MDQIPSGAVPAFQIDPGTLSEIVIFPALFALIAFLAALVVREMTRRSRLRMILDFRLRALDRLASAADAAALLRTGEGEQLLRALAADDSGDALKSKIADAAQNGVVLLAIAAGFATVAAMNAFGAREGWAALAAMAAFAGAGMLLSAALAARLAARWTEGAGASPAPSKAASQDGPPGA